MAVALIYATEANSLTLAINEIEANLHPKFVRKCLQQTSVEMPLKSNYCTHQDNIYRIPVPLTPETHVYYLQFESEKKKRSQWTKSMIRDFFKKSDRIWTCTELKCKLEEVLSEVNQVKTGLDIEINSGQRKGEDIEELETQVKKLKQENGALRRSVRFYQESIDVKNLRNVGFINTTYDIHPLLSPIFDQNDYYLKLINHNLIRTALYLLDIEHLDKKYIANNAGVKSWEMDSLMDMEVTATKKEWILQNAISKY